MSDKSVMFGPARNVAPVSGLWSYFLPTPPIAEGLTVCGHPPRLVLGQQLRGRAPTGLVLEMEIAERLPGSVADDEASGAHADRRTHHGPPGRDLDGLHATIARAGFAGEPERSQVTEGSSERQRFPLMFEWVSIAALIIYGCQIGFSHG